MQSGKIYGYARVSSKHQNEERQLIALRAFGIRDRDIYCDRQSGKDFDRPNYQRLLLRLQAGDVFVVKSIDRLGRNYNEILYQWRLLTKEKQVFIVVLDMPLLDTRSTRDLTGTLIADIVLQLLSYVPKFAACQAAPFGAARQAATDISRTAGCAECRCRKAVRK